MSAWASASGALVWLPIVARGCACGDELLDVSLRLFMQMEVELHYLGDWGVVKSSPDKGLCLR